MNIGLSDHCSAQLLPQGQILPVVSKYNMSHGLSNYLVQAITKDKRGLLWIGTKYGLNRFDGAIFKVYTTQN
ncbi:MAG: two-component regulator propeller domain-containing protein, partial [Saprospiraceae bacterium]